MRNRFILLFLVILPLSIQSCSSVSREGAVDQEKPAAYASMADELEESLFNDLINRWYPLNIDTVYGGFVSDFDADWKRSEGPQTKALVQQARHVWTTAAIYEAYPEKKEFLDYAAHGFAFLRDALWDKEFGGFYYACAEDGSPPVHTLNSKRVYGQAFAVYGLSQYYRMSKDPEALELARKQFLWMEEHAHDPLFGGYFEFLRRDGSPVLAGDSGNAGVGDAPAVGLKDYNSSIHLMEALTELYRVWPDSLVRTRLEEMFYLIRDTFTHPDGYLQLYFYPDWTLVPESTMEERSEGDHWFTQHFTYGHDVETAFLLLETAHILGWEGEEKTERIAKRLVDHSLESGWDHENGGFFDAGKEVDGEIHIINRGKSWWSEVEGLNALLLMHTLYPDDPADYYGLFVDQWRYIDTYLIDKEHGGWYNAGLDTTPDSKNQRKSHAWKTTYHNTRGMINCIRMLRELSGLNSSPQSIQI